MEVGFIGLGAMGVPIARNLIEAGFTLRVWNRDAGKSRDFLSALPAELQGRCQVGRQSYMPEQMALSFHLSCVVSFSFVCSLFDIVCRTALEMHGAERLLRLSRQLPNLPKHHNRSWCPSYPTMLHSRPFRRPFLTAMRWGPVVFTCAYLPCRHPLSTH